MLPVVEGGRAGMHSEVKGLKICIPVQAAPGVSPQAKCARRVFLSLTTRVSGYSVNGTGIYRKQYNSVARPTLSL